MFEPRGEAEGRMGRRWGWGKNTGLKKRFRNQAAAWEGPEPDNGRAGLESGNSEG